MQDDRFMTAPPLQRSNSSRFSEIRESRASAMRAQKCEYAGKQLLRVLWYSILWGLCYMSSSDKTNATYVYNSKIFLIYTSWYLLKCLIILMFSAGTRTRVACIDK